MKGLVGCIVFFISLLGIVHVKGRIKKRVCIVGAGRSGLAAVKKVADQISDFEPMAFERNSDVGGLWIYRESELDEHNMPAHSGIYESLRTITHKDVMVYPDYLTFNVEDDRPFVSHKTFLEYMRNYTAHFKLRRYIQFHSFVTSITVLDKCNQSSVRWHLTSYNLKTYDTYTTVCEAVIVCNGRYSKPNIPVLPGLAQFPGRVMHSRSYRKPKEFTNQVVVILGAGLTGLGIVRDLSDYAKTVYFSHNQCLNHDDLPSNIKQIPGVVRADGKYLILKDNSKIAADTLILCTGYVYNFPFLDDSSGIDLDDIYQLSPMRNYVINDVHPSMAFIGLRDDDGLTSMYYSELEYFLSTLKEQEL